MKSDRLKKLESELGDLEQWMKLGLVPKNELSRHTEEICSMKERISEEKERLQFLKENGDVEEYAAPRRSPSKTVYPDTPSMSDVDVNESSSETVGFEGGTETTETESTETEAKEQDHQESGEDEEDPFSDKNRWKRGGIIDPDSTDW
ncbi:MAG: hypothetical protein S4CHLAM45_09210 [Chlamydiales bacterium]|nr:hypothetical protein [Chlamydiales bacterium]MCH9620522.1 hypothetical protein [Chlamydiales bacterium]MCH9623025.1 hypothetical protein [Chlamydiales bacterium]